MCWFPPGLVATFTTPGADADSSKPIVLPVRLRRSAASQRHSKIKAATSIWRWMSTTAASLNQRSRCLGGRACLICSVVRTARRKALELRKSLDGLWNELRRFVDPTDDGTSRVRSFCGSVPASPSLRALRRTAASPRSRTCCLPSMTAMAPARCPEAEFCCSRVPAVCPWWRRRVGSSIDRSKRLDRKGWLRF